VDWGHRVVAFVKDLYYTYLRGLKFLTVVDPQQEDGREGPAVSYH